MLLLSEKRQLLALKHFLCGARFMLEHTGGAEGEILRGHVLDAVAMVTVALEESNPSIHRQSIERYLEMISTFSFVPAAQFAEKALGILRSTS